jgi:hypothetical protein
MAIGRITGQMLSANLARSGTDLTFETNLLALDVSNSRVGIGTASPATTLHVSATDSLRLPSGNDAQRPGSPANGDIRYNTDQTTIEGYANGAWANLASGTELKDADEDTKVNVEASADLDEIHFDIAGTQRGKISATTVEWGVTGISTTASTITSLTTNGDISITPNGTGEVVLSKVNIAAGEIDGTAIGANSASTGAFTTLSTTGNATIGGDLTVNGTTTTIDSQTLVIEDPLLTLAKNNSGGAGNTFDQGLFMNRGSDDNVSFIWDESADQFAFAVTSGEDGTTAGNVTIDSYAALKAGVATFTDTETATVSAADGTLSMTLANSTGNITTTADIITSDLQTSTVKANDGTAAIAIADSTGVVTISTNVELDGGNVTINESSASVDFRVESNGDTHALFVDGSEDHVGIRTSSPEYDLDIGGSTDALRLPQGDTSQRPTGATGIIRFNTETGFYEGSSDGSTYINFATAGAAPTFTKESTTGDGSTTTFTGFFSNAPESANNVFVYIDNVYQEPTENYSVSGTNITFTSPPHSAARIFAITGADNTSLVTGGVARSESTAVNVSGSSAVTIFSFNASTYRAVEMFVVSQDSGNTEYQAQKAVCVHNGTTAFISNYGITSTAAQDLITVTATHDGSNTVNVQATAENSGTHACKVQYSLLA